MIKAVVYESHTGFTRKYAKILGRMLDVPAYTIKEAERNLGSQSEVVFFGWICAGKIMGYEQAARNFRIQAVGAVGILFTEDKTTQKLADDNRISHCPVFYLPGGYRHDQLGTVYRMMAKMILSNMMNKRQKTERDEGLIRLMREGADFVTVDNLEPVMHFIHACYEKAV